MRFDKLLSSLTVATAIVTFAATSGSVRSVRAGAQSGRWALPDWRSGRAQASPARVPGHRRLTRRANRRGPRKGLIRSQETL